VFGLHAKGRATVAGQRRTSHSIEGHRSFPIVRRASGREAHHFPCMRITPRNLSLRGTIVNQIKIWKWTEQFIKFSWCQLHHMGTSKLCTKGTLHLRVNNMFESHHNLPNCGILLRLVKRPTKKLNRNYVLRIPNGCLAGWSGIFLAAAGSAYERTKHALKPERAVSIQMGCCKGSINFARDQE
jgi:hypothetical protein